MIFVGVVLSLARLPSADALHELKNAPTVHDVKLLKGAKPHGNRRAAAIRLLPFKLEDVCQFVRQHFFSTSARFDRQQQMIAIGCPARPHDHARFSLCVR